MRPAVQQTLRCDHVVHMRLRFGRTMVLDVTPHCCSFLTAYSHSMPASNQCCTLSPCPIMVVGSVTKVGVDFIAILVFGSFNATIGAANIRSEFRSDEVNKTKVCCWPIQRIVQPCAFQNAQGVQVTWLARCNHAVNCCPQWRCIVIFTLRARSFAYRHRSNICFHLSALLFA